MSTVRYNTRPIRHFLFFPHPPRPASHLPLHAPRRCAPDDKDGRTGWTEKFLPLFTCSTAEEFWAGFSRVPRVTDVLLRGKGKPRVLVERVRDGGERVEWGVNGYMLCRSGAQPDYKQEIGGRRVYLNGFSSRVGGERAAGGGGGGGGEEDLAALWEAVLLTVVGEAADPGEALLAAWLQCEKRGTATTYALELWFGVREDRVCEAVCEELREVVAGLGAGVPRLAAFSKIDYFATKHKYAKAGDYEGTPLGGVFVGVPDEPPPAGGVGAGGEGGGGGGGDAPGLPPSGRAAAGARGGRSGRGGR